MNANNVNYREKSNNTDSITFSTEIKINNSIGMFKTLLFSCCKKNERTVYVLSSGLLTGIITALFLGIFIGPLSAALGFALGGVIGACIAYAFTAKVKKTADPDPIADQIQNKNDEKKLSEIDERPRMINHEMTTDEMMTETEERLERVSEMLGISPQNNSIDLKSTDEIMTEIEERSKRVSEMLDIPPQNNSPDRQSTDEMMTEIDERLERINEILDSQPENEFF